MIKLVPQPQYRGLPVDEKVTFFCRELEAFDSDGEDGAAASADTGPEEADRPTSFSGWVRKVQWLVDEMSLTVQTHNIPADLADEVQRVGGELHELGALHRQQGAPEDTLCGIDNLYAKAQILASQVEQEAQGPGSFVIPQDTPSAPEEEEEEEDMGEEEYMAGQVAYCATLCPSQGELIFNALIFYSPEGRVTFSWIKGRTTGSCALFELGRGYTGLLVHTVQMLVAFVSQIVAVEDCPFISQMRNSGLAGVVDSDARAWLPVVVLHDTFVRLATRDDNLLSYPVAESDFPSTPLSSTAGDTTQVIFRQGVRYSHESSATTCDKTSTELDAFFQSIGEAVPGKTEAVETLSRENGAASPTALEGTGAGVPVGGDAKRKKSTEEKRVRRLLKEAHKGLPPGWRAAYDATTKNVYYCNASTGQSQWLKPS